MVLMPVIEDTILIAAPAGSLFALSQDYALRTAWDPFVREMRFLDGAGKAGKGVRVSVRAWTGLTMEVEFVSFLPPRSVAMKMQRGPWFFRQFAGAWLFSDHAAGARVTFRYSFTTRWPRLRPFLDPIIAAMFRRDIRARLRGLKHGAERARLLERTPNAAVSLQT